MFQFLSRNSVRWDPSSAAIAARSTLSFNSSVGILSVGTINQGRLALLAAPKFQFLSRNSVRWDRKICQYPTSFFLFQFLSRNSVRWDSQSRETMQGKIEFQFLSRNSVRWDWEPIIVAMKPCEGFQFLSRNSVRWDGGEEKRVFCAKKSFNSSVGILSVGTPSPLRSGVWCRRFQFLSRNSVRWDHRRP